MQSSASRRAFSFLASKIHPQLPLSQRESQQLLTLLTTSFRAHLDNEHPVSSLEKNHRKKSKSPLPRTGTHHTPTNSSPSSQASASQHISAILTNPLFAIKPRRRGSDPAKFDAHEILRDPLGWFVDQVATGAADIHKATMCLKMLQGEIQAQSEDRRPATQIARWLRSSGLESSREFIVGGFSLMAELVPLLLQEGQEGLLWSWFTLNPHHLLESTSITSSEVLFFKAQLLKFMVASTSTSSGDIGQALDMFLAAHKSLAAPNHGLNPKVLQPAGAFLINQIVANPLSPVSPIVYNSFLQTSKIWTGKWSRAVHSMLCLHHPTSPNTLPGHSYITNPNGAATQIPNASLKRRQFLVQLCLGLARQLLAEQKFTSASDVLEFTKRHFPDIVGTDQVQATSTETVEKQAARNRERIREEDKNLELLDRLLPG